MDDRYAAIEAQLRALRMEFVSNLPSRLAMLREAMQALQTGDSSDPMRSVGELHRIAHGLAGTGTSFGFRAITDTARHLERFVQPFTRRRVAPGESEIDEAAARLNALARAIEEACRDAGSSRRDTVTSELVTADRTLVMCVGDALEPRIRRQLDLFGYHAAAAQSLPRRSAADSDDSAVIVAPLASVPEDTTEAESRHGRRALVVTAETDDLDVRLQVVRRGGDALITAGSSIVDVVETLDWVTAAASGGRYRVLVAMADKTLNGLFCAALERHGAQVEWTSDPHRIVPSLERSRPDIVIIGDSFPGYDGFELATAIRQLPQWYDLPLVFVGTRSGATTRAAALEAEVVPRHVSADELVHVVRSRARATRVSTRRRLGIGGRVYDEGRIMSELGALVHAPRHTGPVVFARVLCDGLKEFYAINGVAAGDRVRAVISRMIRVQLGEDVRIGRVGAQGFVVLSEGYTPEHVTDALNEVVASFVTLQETEEDMPTDAVLCAGVSRAAASVDPQIVDEQVLGALLRAQSEGGQRAVLYDSWRIDLE